MQRDRGWMAVILLCAAVTALTGIGSSLPLDAHEIYVARSAEEMIDAGDFLVPQFNGESRIRKPPLCYWMVIAADALLGADGRVTELEARLPSALAGIALAWLAILMGRILYDLHVALLAGALLVAANGFVAYTHSARPDLVHALLCTAGLLGWMVAERSSGSPAKRRQASLAAWGGWLALGLAILAKGPALPFILIFGWLASAALRKQFRATLRQMRFLTGFIMMVAISLWWFLLVWFSEPTARAILQNETIDRYRQRENPWWELLDPYYLYRSAGLVLPWALPYVFALAAPWNRRLKDSPATARLWWLVIAAMLLLSFSYGRRWYYMLPVIAPIVLLMSARVAALGRAPVEGDGRWLWSGVLAAHILGSAAFVFALALARTDISAGQWTGTLALFAPFAVAFIAMGFIISVAARNATNWPMHSSFITAIGCGLIFTAGEPAGLYWSKSRFERARFAEKVAAHVADDLTLLGFGDLWPQEIYELRRRIPVAHSESLVAAVNQHGELWLLVDTDHSIPLLPEGADAEVVLRSDYDGHVDRLQLWRVRESP